MRIKRMQLFLVFSIFIGLGITNLFAAPQVILNDIKGKVEIKAVNTNSWSPATEGMTISTLTTVSTGFDSSVTITMDKNNIFVKPLTRMTVDKIVEDQGTLTTSCYLRVGSVKASVKSAEGVKQDFKIQSPYSTASVRGTEFEYDGLILNVTEGIVVFIPGRPKRDIQIPQEAEGEAPPDLEGDFAGSPDIPAVEGSEISVPAGSNAVLTLSLSGVPQTQSSRDRTNLKNESVITTTDSNSKAEKVENEDQKQGIKYGSVTVKVTLPEDK